MADRRQEIGEQLADLVREGSELRLAVALPELPDERREAQEAKIEKAWHASKRGKEAARDAGKEIPSPIIAKVGQSFGSGYQPWYSRALRVVEQLLPERYVEFRELYRLDKEPKSLTLTSYRITDYIHGVVMRNGLGEDVFNAHAAAMSKFDDQIAILDSAKSLLHSLLADIEGTLESTLLDNELETAGELLKARHLRSSGIVAGVVLERHLKGVLGNHGLSLGRKKSQIGNLNDALKESKVLDVPRWREIQRLGDIRNLCGHDGEREPTVEEVQELIDGTGKVIATVF